MHNVKISSLYYCFYLFFCPASMFGINY